MSHCRLAPVGAPGAAGSLLTLTSLLLLFSGGCHAAVQPPPLPVATPRSRPPAVSLHWPVPPPPPLRSAAPVLRVALAARLGPGGATAPERAAPLLLRAAGAELLLRDAAGQQLRAAQFSLRWRLQPLPETLRIRRRVIGPFASYESAAQAAAAWRQRGAAVVIARPLDWEVWAPAEAPEPPAGGSRLLERQERARLTLELARTTGPLALQGPLRIDAPAGLLWQGALHRGPFLLQPDAYGSWSLVEEVPLERYLEGVVPHEIGATAPPAALAAQAILARTWAVRNRGRFAVDGYNLCADTQCQVYGDPRLAGAPVRQAIAATRHRVLASAGMPIHAVYHASNGGVAAGYEEGWAGPPLPYLRAFADGPPAFVARYPLPLQAGSLAALLRPGPPPAWGADHPRHRWQRTLTATGLQESLGVAGLGMPSRVEVLERGPSGRVLALAIHGSAGSRVLRLDAIRRNLRQLPSTLFQITAIAPSRWLVAGAGFGHGVGLSQAGAIDLARQGWSTDRILARYYPGSSLVPLRSLGEDL